MRSIDSIRSSELSSTATSVRTSHLVRTGANSIRLGFLLATTDESAYLSNGNKRTNVQYKTYHGTVYTAGSVIASGGSPNGIERELLFPSHEVRFEWENIDERGGRAIPRRDRKLAWLKPRRAEDLPWNPRSRA